jgi:hypothetical protein
MFLLVTVSESHSAAEPTAAPSRAWAGCAGVKTVRQEVPVRWHLELGLMRMGALEFPDVVEIQ